MLRLLRWLPLLLICLAGIGLYRGWFSFTNTSNDKDNKKVNISVSVDENKIEADAEEVKEEYEKVAQEIEKLENHTK